VFYIDLHFKYSLLLWDFLGTVNVIYSQLTFGKICYIIIGLLYLIKHEKQKPEYLLLPSEKM